MEENAEIIKLKTISAAKITASVVAILFMLIFMTGASQGSTRHTVYANSSTKPRIAATLASAKPVDLDNLDKNFPVKVHMIANDKSTNAFLLESDGLFAIVDSGEDENCPKPGIASPREEGIEKLVIAYMKKIGVNNDNLKYYIGTHAHSDHIGSADEIMDAFDVKEGVTELIAPKYDDSYLSSPNVAWDNQIVYDEMIAAAKKHKLKITGAFPLDSYGKDKNFPFPSDPYDVKLGSSKLTIYNASNRVYNHDLHDENGQSLLVKITASNGKTAVIGGDADNFAGTEFAVRNQIGKVDVASVNHHGYYGSNIREYVNTLGAKLLLCPNKKVHSALKPDVMPGSTATDYMKNSYNTFIDRMREGTRIIAAGDVFSKNSADTSKPKRDAVVVALDEKLSNNIPEKTAGQLHSGIKGRYTRNITLSGGLPTEDIPHYNGAVWVVDSKGWKYVFPDDTFLKDGIHTVEGSDYGFDDSGYILKGWISLGSHRYYANGSGVIQKSKWIKYGGALYYMKEDGSMAVSEKTPDGHFVNAKGQRSNFVDQETEHKVKELSDKVETLPKLNKRVTELKIENKKLKRQITKFKETMASPGTVGTLKGKVKNKKVLLKWKRGKMASGYLVYRAERSGKFLRIAKIKGAKKLAFTDAKVSGNSEYRYRVRAYRSIKQGKLFGKFSSVARVKL